MSTGGPFYVASTVQNVFIYTKLFNTLKILFAFYGEGDGGTEELSNLPKVTQPAGSR